MGVAVTKLLVQYVYIGGEQWVSMARDEGARLPLSASLGDCCLIPSRWHNTPPSGGLGVVWGCLVRSLRHRSRVVV